MGHLSFYYHFNASTTSQIRSHITCSYSTSIISLKTGHIISPSNHIQNISLVIIKYEISLYLCDGCSSLISEVLTNSGNSLKHQFTKLHQHLTDYFTLLRPSLDQILAKCVSILDFTDSSVMDSARKRNL